MGVGECMVGEMECLRRDSNPRPYPYQGRALIVSNGLVPNPVAPAYLYILKIVSNNGTSCEIIIHANNAAHVGSDSNHWLEFGISVMGCPAGGHGFAVAVGCSLWINDLDRGDVHSMDQEGVQMGEKSGEY